MTLDEAIKHAEEVAEEKEEQAWEAQLQEEYRTCKDCADCAKEHRQLAEWLKELKQLRKQTKTGHWIDYSEEGFVECSECGSSTVCNGNINELHYCPNCGVKMNEDEPTLKYADQDTMMPAT